MIKITYLKELRDKEDKAVISFEGDVLDIYELRDYAKAINLVKGESDIKDNNYGKADYEMTASPSFKIDIDEFMEVLSEMMETDMTENIVESRSDNDVCDDGELCDIVSDIMEEEAEDLVNHPSHYTNSGMECILEMVMLYGFEETMSFCKLNCHKYRKRALDKGGRTDIDKSNWYVNTYKELTIALETGMTPIQYVLSKMN